MAVADGTRRVRKRIGLMQHQLKLVRNNDKFHGVKGGTGAAKTHGLCYWLIKRLRKNPRQHAFIVAASYDQLRNGFFPTLLGILDELGARNYRYRANPTPMIVFSNGSRIRAMSAKLAERIRSVEIDTLVLEEPQTWDNGEAVYSILLERLRTSPIARKHYGDTLQPQLRLSFNPPSTSHWLYDLIEKQWAAGGYTCVTFSVRQNVLMPRQAEYIAELERRYPKKLWASKIDGQWLEVSGGVFAEFVPSIHGTVPPGLPPLVVDMSRPLLWMHDFNVGRMTSLVGQMHTQIAYRDGVIIEPGKPPRDRWRLPQPNWQRRVLYLLGEIVLENAGVTAVAKKFIEDYGAIARKTKVVLLGDPAGNHRMQTDLATNWATLGEALTRAGIPWSFAVDAADPGVEPRVNAMCAQLENGDGYGVVVDTVECPAFCKDMLEVTWDKTGKGLEKKKDPALTHAADASCYAVHKLREISAKREARHRNRGRDYVAR